MSVKYVAFLSGDDQKLFTTKELARHQQEGTDILESPTEMRTPRRRISIYAEDVMGAPDAALGLLTVSNIRCANLSQTAKASLFSGKPRAIHVFVQVEIKINGSVQQCEKYKKRTITAFKNECAPHFSDAFQFVLRNQSPDGVTVVISVFDDRSMLSMKNNKALGYLSIPLSDVVLANESFSSSEAVYDLAYELPSGSKTGPTRQVGLRLDWRTAISQY